MTDTPPVSPLGADLQVALEGIGASVLDGLRGRSIFITGGTGFVGSWLVEALLHANREHVLGLGLTVLSRNPAAFSAACPHLAGDPALRLHSGDVTSFEPPAGRYDLAVHAALPVAAGAVDHLAANAQAGARRLAAFVRSNGIARLLHVSSGAVYGPQPANLERMDEDTRRDASTGANDYTQAKLLEEQVFGEDVDSCVTARCFALIGPRLPAASATAAAQFIARAAQGQAIVIEGDGSAVRSYQYAADTAAWLLALLAQGQPGRAYNVGSEEAISIAALAHRIGECAHSPPAQVLRQAAPGRAGARYVPSTARAREELGLANRIGLDQAIDRTLRWQRGASLTIAP